MILRRRIVNVIFTVDGACDTRVILITCRYLNYGNAKTITLNYTLSKIIIGLANSTEALFKISKRNRSTP